MAVPGVMYAALASALGVLSMDANRYGDVWSAAGILIKASFST
jgi:hypothetical protein